MNSIVFNTLVVLKEIVYLVIITGMIFVVPAVIVTLLTGKMQTFGRKDYNSYPIVTEKTLRNFGINREHLTKKFQDLYLKLEEVTSNHDTKALKELCVKTLFNEINSNIKEQKKDKVHNKSKDIKIVKGKITQISKKDTRLEAKLIIEIFITEYQEKKDKDQKEKIHNDLVLVTFIKDDITTDGKRDICKNCGAPVKNGEETCTYCDRKTGNIKKYEEWTIKDKEIIL